MIVVGALPFQEANDSETLIKILEVVYDVPEFVSDDCADLLSKMLVRYEPRNVCAHILSRALADRGCAALAGTGYGHDAPTRLMLPLAQPCVWLRPSSWLCACV